MYSQTKIAIPIAQKEKEDVIEVAHDCIRKGADILEFRIDAMNNPTSDLIVEIAKEINFPMIATNRIDIEGGSFKGSEKERVELLKSIAPYVDYIDIELVTDDKYIEEIKNTGTKTIISYHNFSDYLASYSEFYVISYDCAIILRAFITNNNTRRDRTKVTHANTI